MADMKYDIDVSEVVQARREIQKWAKGNSEAFSVVNSHMRTMGKTSELAFNQFGRSASRAQTKWKRFSSVGLQQAGYQIGDFAVQLQGGTNAAVAFGQQGSQLAGIFGPAGAIAGAGLAITTAFVAPLLDAKKAAEDFEGALDSLSSAIDAGQRALDVHKMSVIELTDKYGRLGFEVKESLTNIARLNALEARKAFLDSEISSIDSLITAYDNLQRAREARANDERTGVDMRPLVDDQTLEAIKRGLGDVANEFGLASDEAERLAASYKDFTSAQTEEDKLNAAIDLRDAFSAIPDNVLETNDALRSGVEALEEAFNEASELERITGQVEGSAPGANWMDNAITGVNSLIQRIMVAVAGVEKLNTDLEGPSYSFDPVSGKYKESGDSSTFEERLAERLGLDLGTGTLGSPASKRKGSSGGAGGRGQESAMQQLMRQVELNERLLGLSQARQQVLRALGDEASNYNQKQIDAVVQRIQAYDMEKQALEDARQQMQTMADTLESSMSNAFMTMVEGTVSFKDAMREMARAVIKQLFDILVVQRLVGSFDSTSGKGSGIVGSIMGLFANGAAFNNGKVTAFADGGVVSKPTMFPMANGMGLMGEAGPEAVMPLKRGKGGKLGVAAEGGSSGPVTVNNHFHIAANGDESVKRIIQQEAPKISAMTEKQIINSRRRGGSMKQAFG